MSYKWPNRLKGFVRNCIVTALVFGTVLAIYDEVGPYVADDYFNLIGWGIEIASFAIIAFMGWRLWTGWESGYLLFDDPDDEI